MANRSYLYSLSNRPASYADRPETISGLSEWPYDVPFMYRLLMSGDPRLCASLISDGLEGDEPDDKIRLHAIGSDFATGFARVQRFIAIVRHLVTLPPLPAPPPVPKAPTLAERLKRFVSPQAEAVPVAVVAKPVASAQLLAGLDETIAFLEAHRDEHLLLETVELDCMSEETEEGLRGCVEAEIARCIAAGAALDALPDDIAQAAQRLQAALRAEQEAPLDAFFGLRLDDGCDSTRSGATENPLGLQWSEVLYFELFDRAAFEEAQRG
ncbi:hypothetical protein [Variovorax sp. UMC13]|uniref:DUF7822 domain-containing protein n=1 Tax=Variovorax sp. UMC13 TaxID=1862326 RepID=UPI001602FF96|nr:hypothetical protein [Variovorax sp. UMC13]MBB1602042.1 hypothetical protein [Variovorax sp. UMC13]